MFLALQNTLFIGKIPQKGFLEVCLVCNIKLQKWSAQNKTTKK